MFAQNSWGPGTWGLIIGLALLLVLVLLLILVLLLVLVLLLFFQLFQQGQVFFRILLIRL